MSENAIDAGSFERVALASATVGRAIRFHVPARSAGELLAAPRARSHQSTSPFVRRFVFAVACAEPPHLPALPLHRERLTAPLADDIHARTSNSNRVCLTP